MRRTTRIVGVMLASSLLVLGTAVAQGMSSLNMGVTVDGQDAEGKVTVKDENGAVVAEGAAGTDLAVPEGTHKVILECTSLIDHPQFVNDAFPFRGGQNYNCKRGFTSATITLLVTKGGRRINGDVILRRQGGGDPVAKVRSGSQFKITAGRYEGTFKNGRNEWDIKGLQFPEGAIQSIPVNF
jgi:hypothetical protein